MYNMKKNLSIVSLRTDEIVQPSALETILGGIFFNPICLKDECISNTGKCKENYCLENEFECSVNKCNGNIIPINPPKPDCPRLV